MTQILNFCDKCQLAEWEASQNLAIRMLVNALTSKMKEKLLNKMHHGCGGWDNPEWTIDQIKQAIIHHVEKGDFIDVANLAAFAWNRDEGDSQNFNIGDQVKITDKPKSKYGTVFTVTALLDGSHPYHIRSLSGLVGGSFKGSSLKLHKKAQQ